MGPESTVEKGKRFESEVEHLLRASGKGVAQEQLIGHKKVDLLATELRYGRFLNTAVECKAYAGTVTKAQLVAIWADYEPLRAQGLIHELLVVSLNGYAPAAVTYANSISGFFLQTLTQLRASVIDFSNYCQYVISEYEHSQDEISKYFVPPLDNEHNPLEEQLLEWIDGSSAKWDSQLPIAVLGAYGLGKSTLAKRLGSRVAGDYLAGGPRVPVLIKLGEIAAEQSLEGLLGRHFTALHETPNYSFARFMDLNRSGSFVILLDGFDEMKQLLTWEGFRYNLSMLNRLTDGDSRVILLGRPTAFETDEEHLEALHGVVPQAGTGVRRDTGWPDYQELELAPLTPEQIEQFLRDYLTNVAEATFDRQRSLNEILPIVRHRRVRDLARRPVQLRMLATILPHYEGELDDLDESALYDAFIDELIDGVMKREEEKQARLAFTRKQRREFLTQVAFWLWSAKAGSLVRSGTIPDDLVRPFTGAVTLEAARRDLVVSCPLDRRLGEFISFPHRSFQEFLVAEEIWVRVRHGRMTVAEADALITDEVASFMHMLRSPADAAAVPEASKAEGVIHSRSLNVFFGHSNLVQVAAKRRRSGRSQEADSLSRWDVLHFAASVMSGGDPDPKLLADGETNPPGLLARLFALLVAPQPRAVDREDLISKNLAQLVRPVRTSQVSSKLVSEGAIGPVDGTKLVYWIAGEGKGRLGELTGRGRFVTSRRGYVIADAERLQVTWFHPITLTVVDRLLMSTSKPPQRAADDARKQADIYTLDVRGLRSVFAQILPGHAFVSEWLDGGHLSSVVNLTAKVTVTMTNVGQSVATLKQAITQYEQAREKRFPANRAYVWELPPERAD